MGRPAPARAAAEGETDRGILDAVRYHSVRLGRMGHGRAGAVLRGLPRAGRAFRREWRAAQADRFPDDPAGVLLTVAGERLAHLIESGRPLIDPTVRFWNSLVAPSGFALIAALALAIAGAVALMLPPERERVAGHAYAIPSPGKRIRVEVLNGTRRPGVARVATRALRQQGLDVVFFGTGPASDSTRIYRAPGRSGAGAGRGRGARRSGGW